jgi:uncharacterized membrane protein YdjX (TVP38/TMEM64 family)
VRAPDPAGRSPPSRVAAWGLSALGVMLALAVVALPTVWLLRLDDPVAELERLMAAWGPLAALASIALMVLHSFVPFPAEMLAIANGMLFGPVWGTVVTWSGAMLGAFLAFGLARRFGRPLVERLVAARHRARIDALSARRGGPVLLVSRLIPVISFNLINYAAGLTTISWWTFTWATGLGILPITLVSVLTGAGLLHLL